MILGALKSNEFLRQSRTMAERWGKAGVLTRYDAPAGANHFNVIEPLADPASPMVEHLVNWSAKPGERWIRLRGFRLKVISMYSGFLGCARPEGRNSRAVTFMERNDIYDGE